jgi:hypothetical protein
MYTATLHSRAVIVYIEYRYAYKYTAPTNMYSSINTIINPCSLPPHTSVVLTFTSPEHQGWRGSGAHKRPDERAALERLARDAFILHWNGPNKPWDKNTRHDTIAAEEWRKYSGDAAELARCGVD